MIIAKNLTKRFGPIYALRDVSVKIGEGTTLIVGPNGGGKSTFLRLIVGIYRPTRGEIRVFGRDPWKDKEIKKMIGFSSDPPAFPNFITGREWLLLLSEEKEGGEEEVEKVADLFNIDFLDLRIEKYSSGMRKLLAISQAFIGNPKLIILDEPFSGLDFKNVRKVIKVIMEFKELDVNFLIVSHIWEPLIPLADWMIMISEGRIVVNGPTETAKGEIKRIFKEMLVL